MRIPFEISAKSMKDTDETRGKKFRIVIFMKHACYNTVNGGKKAIKKRAVFQKEREECSCNGKNTVSVGKINDFKGHRSSSVEGVDIATGRTEAGMAAKSNKFKVAATRT
jgi:hypothetical protein